MAPLLVIYSPPVPLQRLNSYNHIDVISGFHSFKFFLEKNFDWLIGLKLQKSQKKNVPLKLLHTSMILYIR